MVIYLWLGDEMTATTYEVSVSVFTSSHASLENSAD